MRRIFKRGLSFLIIVSLLLGATGMDINTLHANAQSSTNIPEALEGYTRITMSNYGIEASTDESGTPHSSSVVGDYTGSLHHTYLDVDVNYNGNFVSSNYFHYFGESAWVNPIRFAPWSATGASFYDTATEPRASALSFNNSTYKIEGDKFFNVKIRTDIITNAEDDAKEDVTLWFYLNNQYVGEMKWTEKADTKHENFLFYMGNVTSDKPIYLRTPVVDEGTTDETPDANPEETGLFEGYTRITMRDYGIDATKEEGGTTYSTSCSGTYAGASLHKKYLDVDVNFNGTFEPLNYLSYFGNTDGTNGIQLVPYENGEGITIRDTGARTSDISVENATSGITKNAFFNLKVKIDIIKNAEDSTEEDVTLQFYMNETYVGKMEWTEAIDTNHGDFGLFIEQNNGSISLKTPDVDPFAGYERITMADYGIAASTEESGTKYTAAKTGTYTGKSLNKTYLDVDVNFNGTFSNYFHYFGEGSWSNYVRFQPYGSGTGIGIMDDPGNSGMHDKADPIAVENDTNGIEVNRFFNVKVKVDIVTNADVITKEDVTLCFYLDEIYVGKMEWTETAGTNHNNFYLYIGDTGSISLRTPGVENDFIDYTRITMRDYGIDATTEEGGTTYSTSCPGTYRYGNLDKAMYIDVDVKFNGIVQNKNYLSYFGNVNGENNIQFIPYENGEGITIHDTGGRIATDISVDYATIGIESGTFFNLKVKSNIVDNFSDSTKEDVTLRFYLNETYVGKMEWTEAADTSHGYFGLSIAENNGSISLKTPDVDPFEGYKRITMASYGITASMDASGTTYETQQSSTYTGTSLNKTYLDVDVNFNGTYTSFFQYFGTEPWKNYIRFQPYGSGTGMGISDDPSNSGMHEKADPITVENDTNGIEVNRFFNVKVRTDIITNATDTTKEDVTLCFYLDGIYVGKMKWTEAAGTYHNHFLLQIGEGGSVSLRTPVIEETVEPEEPVEDSVVYYEDISTYRTENGYTAPEAPAGYIFAGWYKDKACTKENAVGQDETDVAAYAKFVDAKLLTIKAQITAGTTAESEQTRIRFVTAVNDLNYRRVAFLIKIHKDSGIDERDRGDNIVYRELTALVGDEVWKYSPQTLFCSTATYFKAWIINNIPNANFDTKFEVTPYWETLDGTIVYGTTATKTVREGIK